MNTRAGTFLGGFSSLLPALCAVLFLAMIADAQDVAGSKDPAGMKRYEGSEVIGYRAPKFDPEEAFHLIQGHRLTNLFLPPTAFQL